ncbi:Stage III sporulation protein AH [Caloramator mitchellensis]|uniref:Stage III sporulation protein AH n=1 Tax=Caloramator mitchellensis TaxID=908809 RepID=A0A0R3K0B7_CALMK|nr:SpoIIIAH-like family protein [Caloramator mitchellensis]KRQ86836.1 Stage III sporulation protein AH [Caloramator mitchellensis]
MSDVKRQTAIIAVLIVLIAFSGWFAKKFNDSGNLTTIGKNVETKEVTNYFAESRIERQQERDVVKQELEKIISSQDATKTAKNAATTKLMQLNDRALKENKIETLVKEKGFEDSLCFIDDNGVEVVVKTDNSLTSEDANQIKDIVVKTTGISPSRITVRQK